MKMLHTLGVIPARLASTRLPRKVLREIAGRPMLAWVYEAARACPQLDHLVVATDSSEVAELCHSHGWPVELTSPDLPSGSDRVHAVALRHPAEIYVNIQGDEPLLRSEHLTALLAPFRHPHVDATTLKVLCAADQADNPNTVKVVTTLEGRALYFSRSTIPYDREKSGASIYKHLGFYAYRAPALKRFHALPPSPLELSERLEQLRLLENGLALYVAVTLYDTVGVDTEEDLLQVETVLRSRMGSRFSARPPQT